MHNWNMLTLIFQVLSLFLGLAHEEKRADDFAASLVMEKNNDAFRGFFKLNQTCELSFVIRRDFVCLRRIRGQEMFLFYQYAQDVYYLKVLDTGILRYKNKEYSFPWDVPQESPLEYLMRKYIQHKIQHIESFPQYLQVKRLFKVRRKLDWKEVEILANISEAISQRTKSSASKVQNQLIQRFHLLVKELVNVAGPPLWSRKLAANFKTFNAKVTLATVSTEYREDSTKKEDITSRFHGNEPVDSCSDMRNSSDKHCFGMCGMRCWCWPWVCGDCCLHKGCLQHDKCCRRRGYTSIYCFCPWIFGFDCKNGYTAYPECLYT